MCFLYTGVAMTHKLVLMVSFVLLISKPGITKNLHFTFVPSKMSKIT